MKLYQKLFLILILIGLGPLVVFSFLTINNYQDLLKKQNQHLTNSPEIIQETEEAQKNILIQTFLIITLISLLVIFFSIILTRKFLYPIKKLTEGTEKLKGGDLNTKINIPGKDEFAQLAKSFNRMASRLNENIKELKKSKQAIKKEREKSEEEKHKVASIISNFSDPIIMADNNWKLSLLNPAARKIFKLSNKDLGKRIKNKKEKFSFQTFKKITSVSYSTEIIKTDSHKNPIEEEVVIKSDKGGENNPFKTSHAKYNKNDIIYKVITEPVCDENQVCYGHIKVFYNLTREKILDGLKSEFISIAAHQLRTPLTAIKWAIKMTVNEEMGPLKKEQKEILNQGYESNERVIKLVNDMLNVSRIEEGRFGYSFGKHDIGEAAKIVITNLKNKIDEKNISFIYDRPKNIPKIYMDKEKIELVIQNLLENSVKFTPKGGKITLKIKVGKKDIKIIVGDNGLGIPKKNQKKLFTKFFRAENAVRKETEGTGLGLFIVKNVIDKHKGAIECESEELKGTKFTVTLPLKK